MFCSLVPMEVVGAIANGQKKKIQLGVIDN
jgi:hypothetical protein